MAKTPKIIGIHAKPSRLLKIILGLLPFILLIALYLFASHERLKANPKDKLLPSVSSMIESTERMALTKDRRKDTYLMLTDTLSSLKRLCLGVGAASLVGLFLGVNMGVFPGLRVFLLPFTRFVAIIPPLALLPILFISFGVDELGKIVLIFWGTVFVITRDMVLTTQNIHKEQIIKALTLGASQLQIVYHIVMPQILPRLLETLRLSLGAAWLFLIAAEAIASTDGLGYRIFLVRRYLAMDVIIPYVLWITCIGFLMDWGLRLTIRWLFPWYIKD